MVNSRGVIVVAQCAVAQAFWSVDGQVSSLGTTVRSFLFGANPALVDQPTCGSHFLSRRTHTATGTPLKQAVSHFVHRSGNQLGCGVHDLHLCDDGVGVAGDLRRMASKSHAGPGIEPVLSVPTTLENMRFRNPSRETMNETWR